MWVRLSHGDASGVSLMKFTLTYDGELRSNARPALKWDIRKSFNHQLKELWELNPALQELRDNPWAPLNMGFLQMSYTTVWQFRRQKIDLNGRMSIFVPKLR